MENFTAWWDAVQSLIGIYFLDEPEVNPVECFEQGMTPNEFVEHVQGG